MAGKAALFDEQGRMTHLLKNMAAICHSIRTTFRICHSIRNVFRTCHRAHELFHSVTLRLSKVTRCRPSVSRHLLRHLAAAGVGRKAADMGEEELGRRWEEELAIPGGRARPHVRGRSLPTWRGALPAQEEELAGLVRLGKEELVGVGKRSSAGTGGRARWRGKEEPPALGRRSWPALGRKSSPFRCREELASMCGGEACRCGEEELRRRGRKSSPAWKGGARRRRKEELCWRVKKSPLEPPALGRKSSREEELRRRGKESSPACTGKNFAGVGRKSSPAWGGGAADMGRKKNSLADLFDLVEQLHNVKLTLGNLDMDSIYVKNLDGSIKLLVLLTEERHSVAMDPITLGFSYFIKQEFCTSDKLRSYPDDWDDYRKGEFLMSLQNMHPRSLRELFKNVDGIGWPVKDKYLPKILSDIVEVDSLQGREHNLKDFSDYVNLLRNRYKHFNGLPDEVKAVLVNRKGLVKIISEWTPNFWIVVYERTGWPKTNLPGSLL
uniref:KEN domain-containing protein n=1 Tax=Oryza nivara TaxID=4536 RepID=A0A0E0HA82_ORYNI